MPMTPNIQLRAKRKCSPPDRSHSDASVKPPLSVVVPVFNERDRIPQTLLRITTYLQARDFEYELIVVDDGSEDDTLSALESVAANNRNVLVINAAHRGKGAAVRLGVLAASKTIVMYCDADLAVPIEEVEKLLKHIGRGFDIAIASKNLPQSNVIGRSFRRKLMGHALNLLVRMYLLTGIKDTQCGFKCFTANAAKNIFPILRSEGFGFDIEVLRLAKDKGYCIVEVPVTCTVGPRSTVKPLRDSWAVFTDLCKIIVRRWRAMPGEVYHPSETGRREG
jgi:dolichyl-phosphate beta-glucosyltransferase